MARIVVLDSGPFGLIAGPGRSPVAARCQGWVRGLLARGIRVVVPEVVDYEIRREMLMNGATAGIARLDRILAGFEFAPITRDVMLRAAEFWAVARRGGFPGAHPEALDVDVIIAATAELIAGPGDTVTVATGNVGHLGRFVDARTWTHDHELTSPPEDGARSCRPDQSPPHSPPRLPRQSPWNTPGSGSPGQPTARGSSPLRRRSRLARRQRFGLGSRSGRS